MELENRKAGKRGDMIGWLIDRLWALRHRAELEQLDRQGVELDAMRARLDRRMEESFGPDWRAEAERRVGERLKNWTVT